jgi:hypothetical protein
MAYTFATVLRDILEQTDDNALVLGPGVSRLGADLHQRHGGGARIGAAG